MKYGIKVEGTKILGINRFKNDIVPIEYEELDNFKYDYLVSQLMLDNHGTYEGGNFKTESPSKRNLRIIEQGNSEENKKNLRDTNELKDLAKQLKTLGITTIEIENLLN